METSAESNKRIAVIIPCYNEELSVAKVVSDCRSVLPLAQVYVCDNHSSDRTAERAKAAGAEVIQESRRGKGFAVRALLEHVSADIYVLIDGDDTYPVESAPALINELCEKNVDMVVGSRLSSGENSFRRFHRLGNRLIAGAINQIFESSLTDVMSGLRVFSGRFARNVPLVSRGFEIETQMTVQALYYQFGMCEMAIQCRERAPESISKLSTWRDGIKIILSVINAFKAYRPLLFFSFLGFFAVLFGFVLSVCPENPSEMIETMAHLSFGVGVLSVFCGLILDTLNHRLREVGQLVSLRTEKRFRD
jgi:glycosyltransferase involved in cell wall biosynthesis